MKVAVNEHGHQVVYVEGLLSTLESLKVYYVEDVWKTCYNQKNIGKIEAIDDVINLIKRECK